MRPLVKLTFDAMMSRLRVRFNGLQRIEADGNYNYSLSDILMSGVAMFFFQDPSLLAFLERLLKKHERCNLQTMFGVKAVPKDSQMRERLDEVEWEEGAANKRKYYRARIAREVPLRADGQVWVTYLEVWERNKKGKQIYHNGFITDLEVTKGNVAEIIGMGRAKWKIENEQFNIQKNHGYHLEHNYGHGEKNLSGVFYYLNLIAYLIHIILRERRSGVSKGAGDGRKPEAVLGRDENLDEKIRVGKLARFDGVCGK